MEQILKKLPDFYLEMQWNFDSMIPLVSMLTPNDTLKIWKYKSIIRVDSTLAGFSNLKCKRRDMSLLYFTDK